MTIPVGNASARLPLERARFFLMKAAALTDVDRVELDHYLTAAVVFGRSAFHYLETPSKDPTTDLAYRKWFAAMAKRIKGDQLIQHFRDARNSEIHVRRVPLTRHVSVHASAVLRVNAYAEMRVKRGRPWYRRSPAIWWQDISAAVLRPIKRWRYRIGLWGWRQRAAVESRIERIRWRFRRPAKVTVAEFFLDDPEGLNRPAVVLIDAYLGRWDVIVAEAETKFAHIFA
jgi:hypothetical protein